jgi:hypothetical protein
MVSLIMFELVMVVLFGLKWVCIHFPLERCAEMELRQHHTSMCFFPMFVSVSVELLGKTFNSQPVFCFFCVVLLKLHHCFFELTLCLQFTVYVLGREKNRILRNLYQTNNKQGFGIGKAMWRLSGGRVMT